MNAPVTVVTCVYGDRGYERFISQWEHAIKALDPRPDAVLAVCDRNYPIGCAHVFCADCTWQYPQAFYLQQAVSLAMTEWVWIVDIDDLALPDALAGIDDVDADVWQMGFHRSDGVTHIPPRLTGADYLMSLRNVFAAGSAFRLEAFNRAGGFPDIAFQDWGLWRRLARSGATFESSARAHYRYMLHDDARTAVELVGPVRARHVLEMIDSEVDMSEIKRFADWYVETYAQPH